MVVQTYSNLEVGLLDRDVDSTENEVHKVRSSWWDLHRCVTVKQSLSGADSSRTLRSSVMYLSEREKASLGWTATGSNLDRMLEVQQARLRSSSGGYL